MDEKASASRLPERDRPWVMRTYAGHSSAAATNALFRRNLAKGQTGLSVAFDLPTQTGYDPDHELAGALQHDAHPGPPVRAGVRGVSAEHRNLARIAAPVALQDLHRGGLAGAVRAEQSEHLATAYVEVHARHRDVVAVRLAQPSDGDGQLVIHGVKCASWPGRCAARGVAVADIVCVPHPDVRDMDVCGFAQPVLLNGNLDSGHG